MSHHGTCIAPLRPIACIREPKSCTHTLSHHVRILTTRPKRNVKNTEMCTGSHYQHYQKLSTHKTIKTTSACAFKAWQSSGELTNSTCCSAPHWPTGKNSVWKLPGAASFIPPPATAECLCCLHKPWPCNPHYQRRSGIQRLRAKCNWKHMHPTGRRS